MRPSVRNAFALSVFDTEKMIKNPLLYHYLLWVKTQISIGNAKIKKQKTWPHSKIILDQGHVLGNTNFSRFVFLPTANVISKIEHDYSFFQINDENTKKKIIAVA